MLLLHNIVGLVSDFGSFVHCPRKSDFKKFRRSRLRCVLGYGYFSVFYIIYMLQKHTISGTKNRKGSTNCRRINP